MISFSFSTKFLDDETSALFCFWIICELKVDGICVSSKIVGGASSLTTISISMVSTVSSCYITRFSFIFFLYISFNLVSKVVSTE